MVQNPTATHTRDLQATEVMNYVTQAKTSVPNQQIWYPVIKFRGLRITYQMDRPGHGGWGG